MKIGLLASLLRQAGARSEEEPFHLLRWFSITALVSVAAVSLALGFLLSSFLTERMVRQDAEGSAALIRNVLSTNGAVPALQQQSPQLTSQLADAVQHLAHLPDVLRVNIYGADRVILWSTDPALVHRRFDQNDELEDALRAHLVINSGIVERSHLPKSEHVDFEAVGPRFIEIYTPIVVKPDGPVVAVVEIYKVPRQLFDAIRDGTRLIWLGAGMAGAFLYLALFWIIRKAHFTIEAQRERLIEAESLAVVGEMGSAVAHGLRNPLASIRSSAELAQEDLPREALRECAQDIVTQVDRLEGWINQLLSYARPTPSALQPVDANAVARQAVDAYWRELQRQEIRLQLELEGESLYVQGEHNLLTQLVGSLIANASEALGHGGEIRIRTAAMLSSQYALIEVRDTGPGMNDATLAKVFQPFFTSKPRGLGLGLPLVRRVTRRFGGRIELDSTVGKGTAVRLWLPRSQEE